MTGAFALPTWEERGGEYVNRLVRDLNLTIDQAAGLVGNLGYESRGFETLQEIKPMVAGSRGGYGVAQWTAGRRRAFEAWCAQRLLQQSSDEANYGFLVHELRGAYKSFADRLRKTTGIEDACRLTHKEYETPSDVLDGSYRSGMARLDWAQRALSGAQGASPAPVTVPDATMSPLDTLKAMQTILARDGYYQAVIDGLWGARSRNALGDLLAAAGQPRV